MAECDTCISSFYCGGDSRLAVNSVWIINQIKINISEANAYFPDEIASRAFDM